MDVPVNSSWPCSGPLLDLAVALAKKLLPGKNKTSNSRFYLYALLFFFFIAFNTATGKLDKIV
jgi:hypothetical protein